MRLIVLTLIGFCVGSPLGMAQRDKAEIRLTLKEALGMADRVNLAVMMASARVEGAIARLEEARSDLLPHVEWTLTGGRQSTDTRAQGLSSGLIPSHLGPYNNFNARPRVTVSLFDAAAFERFQAARKGEKFSEDNREKIREDVLALVASLFVDAKRRSQAMQLLYVRLEKDQMAYDLARISFDQGTATELDVNQLRANLDKTQYLYKQAEARALEARLDLGAALQLSLEKSLVFMDDEKFLQTLDGASLPNSSSQGRLSRHDIPQTGLSADVAEAASYLKMRLSQEKAAKAGFLPKISGSADYGRMGTSPSKSSNTYFVGVQVSVPIWEGGAQEARLKEAKANLKEAQEGLADTTHQARVKIEKARVFILEADDLLKARWDQKEVTQKSLTIALRAQAAGTSSAFDVMKAKVDLAGSQDVYNEARAVWVMSRVDLLHAQGRLRELLK